jgi:hypothetical protein
MAIKAGQILHVGNASGANDYVINRIQSAGPGNVNIPEEKIYELGNFNSVATVRDIPDLSFDVESLSVSCEMEALLTDIDPTTVEYGDAVVAIDLLDFKPIDIQSPFKSATNQFDIVRGIAIPHLTLERASYRFGLRQNSTQQFTLRGDSIFYIPGVPKHEIITNTGTGPYSFGSTPTISYTEAGDTYYAYNVTLKDSTSNAYKRLFIGTDYTNTSTNFTLTDDLSGTYDEIHVTYGSTAATSYNDTVHAAGTQPSAIRGRDIDVYVSDGTATPTLVRWTGVQSFEATWSVSLETDEEFGNIQAVDRDFDVPEVTGSIGLKTADPTELFDRIANIAGVSTSVTAGAISSTPLELEVRLSDPDTGNQVKTFYIEDARFTVPSWSGRTQTKLETTFNFTSDGGNLKVYNGARP